LKKKLSRAELEERKLKRQALLSKAELTSGTTADGKHVVVNKDSGKAAVVENLADAPKSFPVKSSYDETVIESEAELAAYKRYLDKMGVEGAVHFIPVKEAYHLGGGGVNDPQTYPVDPTNDSLKTKGDKQMEGTPMETGKDGLHPGDLELKKKHLRASFKLAKVAGKTDRGNSKWTVFADDEVILEATGAEAFEDELDSNWTTFASERYGREVLRAIRSEGLSKVARLLKGEEITKTAQPPMVPEVPAAAPVALPEAEDKGDDPVESALKALTDHLQETEKALGDLKDAMQEKSGETEADLPSPAEAEASDAGEVLAALDESADELSLIAEALETRVKAGKSVGDATVDELLRLSKTASEDNISFREQAAELIAEAKKKEEDEEEEKEEKEEKKGKKGKKEEKEDEDEEDEEKEEKKEKKSKAEAMLENLLKARASKRREIARTAMDEGSVEEALRQLREDVDALLAAERGEKDEEGELEHPNLASDLEVSEMDDECEMADDELDAQLAQLLDEGDEAMADDEEDEMPKTAEERRAWRERVAAAVAEQGQKMDLGPAVAKDTDMPLAESHKLEGLSIKTDEAVFEGIEDQYNKIMNEVKNLPKVREAVNHMVKLMRVGALGAGDLDNTEKLEVLAVDPAAAKYWKEYFGQGDKDSSAFGVELTKEMTHKKAQASVAEQRARLRRAYDVAVEMQEKGMIDDGVDALHKQADALVALDDGGFDRARKIRS
ncbi:MAG: hypothetical protein ACWGQW_06265, partial [bacterium]